MTLSTSSNALSKINTKLNAIKEELDEHCESINDNTNEIQANYEYLLRLDEKIEKLNEKIDELLMMKQIATKPQEIKLMPQEIKLTEQEKAIFLLLYCSSEKPLTYEEIAQSLNQNELLVSSYVTNMIEKGIPIRKFYINRTVSLELDKDFRDLQAKHNLLKINQTTMKQFA